MRVWISRENKMYRFFWFVRKLKLIKVIPCDSYKNWVITK